MYAFHWGEHKKTPLHRKCTPASSFLYELDVKRAIFTSAILRTDDDTDGRRDISASNRLILILCTHFARVTEFNRIRNTHTHTHTHSHTHTHPPRKDDSYQ